MKSLIFIFFLLTGAVSYGTEIITLPDFIESTDPETYDPTQWDIISDGLHAAWGSTDFLYKKGNVPVAKDKTISTTLWKGERGNLLFLLWTRNKLEGVQCSVSDLRGGKGVINANNVATNFVRYTLSDKFTITPGSIYACAARTPHKVSDSHLVPDILDYIPQYNIEAKTTRPVWVTIQIPDDTEAGVYNGEIVIRSDSGSDEILSLTVNVLEHTLPPPSKWNFHLDLWQNCVSIKRYHNVELWSDDHFILLEEYFKVLADAGQKVITAVINHGGQSFDDWYESMITWQKNVDGSWTYDYSVFDRFVESMMKIGIDKQINCYSMYPWGATRYFDVAKNGWVSIQPEPNSQEFEDFWSPFLADFKSHLIQKGWFEKTAIAMDEKLEPIMKGVIDFIKKTEPEFKIALAGGYIESLQDDIYDLSIFVGHPTTLDNMQRRISQGKPTTFYTSCAWPEHPNQFTFSPPAESAVVGWFAYSQGYTGFLRWAFNIWQKNVLKDTRCSSAPAGDQHLMYPGPRKSVRMVRLMEGIQDYEKICIIKRRLEQLGTSEAIENNNKLNTVLAKFTLGEMTNGGRITELVNDAKSVLNEVSANTPVNQLVEGKKKALKFFNGNSVRDCKVYVEQTDNPYFSDFQGNVLTIEMWVNPGDGEGVLISTKSQFADDPGNDSKSGGFEFHLQYTGWGRATFCTGNGGNSSYWYNAQALPGEWAHLAFVIEGPDLIVYKNGEKTFEQSFDGPIAKGIGDLVIGRNPNWDGGEFFNGEIADVRIWKIARSQAEIKQDMNVYFTKKKENLIANWTMQEGEGNVLSNLMHSSRNRANVIFTNDMGINGIKWMDSTCPITAEDQISSNALLPYEDDMLMKEEYYNLQGIRIEKPSETGIYILKRTYSSLRTEVIKCLYQQ